MRSRWRCILAALTVVGAACGDQESAGVEEQPTPSVADWSVSSEIGAHLGPFPTDALTGEPGSSEWFSVVLPVGDPIDAFHALLAEATAHGLDTGTSSGGPCRQSWSREAVSIDEDDEEGGGAFQGETPFGEELPRGAVVVAITCEAEVGGGGEHVAVSTKVPLQAEPAGVPVRRPPILLVSPSPGGATVDIERQELGLPTPATYEDGPLTPAELHGLLDAVTPLAPLGLAWYPNDQGGCFGVVLRSSGSPQDAVDTVVDQSPWRASFEERSIDREVAGRHAVARRGSTGGGQFVATAVQTATGSDVFICAIDA